MLCTEISLPTEYSVPKYPHRLRILYWKILTDGTFCTGKSLPNILYWNVLAAGHSAAALSRLANGQADGVGHSPRAGKARPDQQVRENYFLLTGPC
jgi:hypothetical protein